MCLCSLLEQSDNSGLAAPTPVVNLNEAGKPMCTAEDCPYPPRYGYPHNNQALFCRRHAVEGMTDLQSESTEGEL